MLYAAVAPGSLAQWVTVLMLLVVGLPLLRGARGSAVRDLRDENKALERDCKQKDEAIRVLRSENVRLEATRDLEPLQKAMLDAITRHNVQMEAEHSKQLVVLEMIADRLGPNHDV